MFDVDAPENYLPPEITPYSSTFNKADNKHHTLFLLDKPIHTSTQAQKEWYQENIGSVLQKIYFLTNSDPRYKNVTTKNPFNEDAFRVNFHGATLSSVFDLISLYNDDLNEVGKIESAISSEDKYISAHYRELVSALIEHSQLNSKLLFGDRDQFKRLMYLKATQLSNGIKSLNESEAKAICEDVISKSIAWSEAISKRQQLKSMTANKKRWGDTVERNKKNIYDAILTLLSSEQKTTLKNISLLVGLSVRTLKEPHYSLMIRKIKETTQQSTN